MEDIYIGTPNAKQDEFLRCKKKYVAFGGARGGGKSWAVRCKAKLLAQRYPGIRMLLVRRTMPEIEANHLETLRLELAGTAVYRAEERRFVFGNGSVLQFGYCACDRDADRYQGAEYDVIFFDEATQLKEQWMRKLAACVRGVNGFPKRIYYTCNPGGPGHGYIKRLFIDRRYEPGENGGEYAFIPARVTDNGALLARQALAARGQVNASTLVEEYPNDFTGIIGLHTYSQSPHREYEITLTGNWVERGGFRFQDFVLTRRKEVNTDGNH